MKMDLQLQLKDMKVENLEKSRVKATFTVTTEDFAKALDKAFEIQNAKVTIHGFRKGHAPRSVYEKTYGVESLYDEALNAVLNEKASEVFADKELGNKVIGQFQPNIETKDWDPKKEFEISLTFDVFPAPELPQYKGLEVAKKVLTATEEEVEAAVKATQTAKATLVVKDEQVIAAHDTAKFDFLGKVDGVAFEGGQASDYEMEIGSGQFIPGFEDQMIGMKAGETKDVNVTFPEQYPAADLAGKPAVFTVTVKEVKTSVLPELNDEFVASLNIEGVKTVEELKAAKKAELEKNKEASEKDRQLNDLINQILDNTKVELPETLINDRVKQIRGQYEQQAKMYNIPFDTFLGLMNTNEADFMAQAKAQAERQSLFSVVLNKIVEEEKLQPTDAELMAKAEEVGKATKQNAKQVLSQRGADIFNELVYNKVIELITSTAKEI